MAISVASQEISSSMRTKSREMFAYPHGSEKNKLRRRIHSNIRFRFVLRPFPGRRIPNSTSESTLSIITNDPFRWLWRSCVGWNLSTRLWRSCEPSVITEVLSVQRLRASISRCGFATSRRAEDRNDSCWVSPVYRNLYVQHYRPNDAKYVLLVANSTCKESVAEA